VGQQILILHIVKRGIIPPLLIIGYLFAGSGWYTWLEFKQFLMSLNSSRRLILALYIVRTLAQPYQTLRHFHLLWDQRFSSTSCCSLKVFPLF